MGLEQDVFTLSIVIPLNKNKPRLLRHRGDILLDEKRSLTSRESLFYTAVPEAAPSLDRPLQRAECFVRNESS